MAQWHSFAEAVPALAAFGQSCLERPPRVSYLGTVGADGLPRVHPVTPILGDGRLFVFMEPTSPKGRDLRERLVFALHNGVPDNEGTGGEFFVRGLAEPVDDPTLRAARRGRPATRQPIATCCSSSACPRPAATVTATCPCRSRGVGGTRSSSVTERDSQPVERREHDHVDAIIRGHPVVERAD
jgi:hypothetical protein